MTHTKPDLRPRLGAIVRIRRSKLFFKKGAKAELCYQDADGDWWADFEGLGNPADSFDPKPDGVWCVGRGLNFEVVG